MNERERDWLRARKECLTASDVASVLGIPGAYGSQMSVWADKVSPELEPDEETRDYILFGRDVEGSIATGYERKFGRPVYDPGAFTLQTHPDIPWLAATRDRVTHGSASHPAPANGTGPLELKAVGFSKVREWAEAAPLPFQVQAQVQMACSGAEWASLCALFGGVKLGEPVDVLRNDAFLRAAFPHLEAFWLKVQRREVPEVDGSPATTAALRHLWGGPGNGLTVALDHVQADPFDLDKPACAQGRCVPGCALLLADELEAARSVAAEHARELQRMKNTLAARIGPATFGALPDGSYLGLREVKRDAYEVEATTYRPLRRIRPRLMGRRRR